MGAKISDDAFAGTACSWDLIPRPINQKIMFTVKTHC